MESSNFRTDKLRRRKNGSSLPPSAPQIHARSTGRTSCPPDQGRLCRLLRAGILRLWYFRAPSPAPGRRSAKLAHHARSPERPAQDRQARPTPARFACTYPVTWMGPCRPLHDQHPGAHIAGVKTLHSLRLFLLLALCSVPLVCVRAEGTNASPGLAVGTKAPSFTLAGQDGREHSLADLLKTGRVALVFYRSADW
jgi:hypothetical protein